MDITILGVSGSQFEGGSTERYLMHALSIAAKAGARTDIVALTGRKIHDCRQCNFCVKGQDSTNFCCQQDSMKEIYPKVLNADGIIIASPVNFGRCSVQTALFINRLRVFVRGNLYGGRLRNKIGAAMCVGWRLNAGIETTLLSVDYAFLALEMIVAGVHDHGSFYGAGSYSSIEGSGKFIKNKQHVLENEIGMKSAEAVAARVVELARMVRAGEAALSTGSPVGKR